MQFQDRLIDEIPHLRRFARSLAGSVHDADDLVQATLERALTRGAQLRNPGSLRSWLFRILYNVHLSARARSSAGEIPTDFTESDTLTPPVPPRDGAQLDARTVLAALAALPVDQRAALTLTAVEELSYSEAAAALDIPVGTLMSRIFRGRQRLRTLFDPAQCNEGTKHPLKSIK